MDFELIDSIAMINIKELNLKVLNELETQILKNIEIKYINLKLKKDELSKIKILLEKKYEIVTVEEKYYIFSKKVFRNRSLRISLTEKCNYRCFFCHEEGLEMDVERDNKSFEEIYNLVKAFILDGYDDITFTGGEPLIKYKEIIEFIKRFNKEKFKTSITIVTNGYLINDELLDAIKTYKGDFKFNVSMHSVNKKDYLKIVNPKDHSGNNFETVVENIKKIKENDLYLKLNFVLLKEINTSKEKINEIIEFCMQNKVDRIKFLELLITDKLLNMYDYYYQIDGIKTIIKDKADYTYSDNRRDVYKAKNGMLETELQKCSCELGCNNCLIDKDISISQELKYFPCFVLGNKPIIMNKDNIKANLEKGGKIIEGYANRYGDSSPRIISSPNFILEKIEYYYYVKDKTFEEFSNDLKEQSYKIKVKRYFAEKYYKPNYKSERWDKFERVLKVYSNSYNENEFVEIIQDINYTSEDNNFLQTVKYLSGTTPLKINNLDEYESKLEILEYSKYLEYSWQLLCFEKSGKKLSVAYNETTNNITILSIGKPVDPNIINLFNLRKLNEPLLKYLGRTV